MLSGFTCMAWESQMISAYISGSVRHASSGPAALTPFSFSIRPVAFMQWVMEMRPIRLYFLISSGVASVWPAEMATVGLTFFAYVRNGISPSRSGATAQTLTRSPAASTIGL